MTIKEKARAYDKALERARALYSQGAPDSLTLESMFPELAESEDEKIRKEIINVFKSLGELKIPADINFADIFTWLEKQGMSYTKRDIDNAYLEGMAFAKDELEKQNKQILANSAKTCKDEQKPTDKVEPKFKVGDWITNSIETVQITGYDIDYGYQVDYEGNLQHRDTDIIENEYHLWTIQDAQDGDVLQLGGVTVIFKEYIGYENCKCYCSVYHEKFEIPIEDGEDNIYGCTNATPATKKQRDLLFKKMKEAGYEWDDEKKELKKIEQESTWSEKDRTMAFTLMRDVDQMSYISKEGKNERIGWLNSLDEKFASTKSAWNEKDEEMLNDMDITLFEEKSIPNIKYWKFINWLKSLKQRRGWKPSDEQVGLLQAIVNEPNNAASESCQIVLKEVIKQMKKLME